MRVIKNQYEVYFVDGTRQKAVAVNVSEISDQYDTQANPIAQVTRVATGIEVIEPEVTAVNFTTLVTPAGAITAGGLATPASFAVKDGTKVIFSAIPPASGYTFTGWFLGGVLQSTSLIAEILVSAPAIAGQTVQYEARFA